MYNALKKTIEGINEMLTQLQGSVFFIENEHPTDPLLWRQLLPKNEFVLHSLTEKPNQLPSLKITYWNSKNEILTETLKYFDDDFCVVKFGAIEKVSSAKNLSELKEDLTAYTHCQAFSASSKDAKKAITTAYKRKEARESESLSPPKTLSTMTGILLQKISAVEISPNKFSQLPEELQKAIQAQHFFSSVFIKIRGIGDLGRKVHTFKVEDFQFRVTRDLNKESASCEFVLLYLLIRQVATPFKIPDDSDVCITQRPSFEKAIKLGELTFTKNRIQFFPSQTSNELKTLSGSEKVAEFFSKEHGQTFS